MAEAGFIRSQLLSRHGITGIFSLRSGGVSPAPFDSLNFGADLGDSDNNITQNMHRLIESAALPSTPHQAIQVHKCNLLWCSGQGETHQLQADILLTDQIDTAVCVRVADCLPILLADPESGLIAAVHAGWRGTAASVVKKAIGVMLEHGAKPKNLLASLGPCIGPCCFEIGSETAAALARSATHAAHFMVHTPDTHADLAEINRLQLLESGLDELLEVLEEMSPEIFGPVDPERNSLV